MGFRLIDVCGQRTECDVCNGSGCDHCGDVGTVPCPCATGHYVHGVAVQGESCTECGDTFPTGADILRSAPVPVVGGDPIILPHGWHTTCR